MRGRGCCRGAGRGPERYGVPSKGLAVKVSETSASELKVNCTEIIGSVPKWNQWIGRETLHMAGERGIRAVFSTSLSSLKELGCLNRWLLSTADSQKASTSAAQSSSLAGPRGQP